MSTIFDKLKQLDQTLSQPEAEEEQVPKEPGLIRSILGTVASSVAAEIRSTAASTAQELGQQISTQATTSLQRLREEATAQLRREKTEVEADEATANAKKEVITQRRSEALDLIKALLLPDASIAKQKQREKERLEAEKKKRGVRWPKPAGAPVVSKKEAPPKAEPAPSQAKPETAIITKAREMARRGERHLRNVTLEYNPYTGQVTINAIGMDQKMKEPILVNIQDSRLMSVLVPVLIDLGHVDVDTSLSNILIAVEKVIDRLRTEKHVFLT